MLGGGGAYGDGNFGLAGRFHYVSKGFSFSDEVWSYWILRWGGFFNITRIFRTSSPIRDVVLAAINAFDFFSFVFLNGTLGIMMISSAFVAAGEEITNARGMWESLAIITLLRPFWPVWGSFNYIAEEKIPGRITLCSSLLVGCQPKNRDEALSFESCEAVTPYGCQIAVARVQF